jgi:predicted RNA-binding protein
MLYRPSCYDTLSEEEAEAMTATLESYLQTMRTRAREFIAYVHRGFRTPFQVDLDEQLEAIRKMNPPQEE